MQCDWKEAQGNLGGKGNVLYLNCGDSSHMYISFKTHQTVYLTWVQFLYISYILIKLV